MPLSRGRQKDYVTFCGEKHCAETRFAGYFDVAAGRGDAVGGWTASAETVANRCRVPVGLNAKYLVKIANVSVTQITQRLMKHE